MWPSPAVGAWGSRSQGGGPGYGGRDVVGQRHDRSCLLDRWVVGTATQGPSAFPPDELPGTGDGLERWCGHELHAAQVDSERSGWSDGA